MSWTEPQSDAWKPTDSATRLGQVFTPEHIADLMVKNLMSDKKTRAVTILDPCVGSGIFPASLRSANILKKKDEIVCFDVDPEMIRVSKEALSTNPAQLKLHCRDYLLTDLSNSFDYAILNPPYIRQEWIENKKEYIQLFKEKYGVTIPGTSNLYVYFIIKVLEDIKLGGSFSCIVYDSFKVTKFGRVLFSLLNACCENVAIEPVGAQPFLGRLIDAVIVSGIKKYQVKDAAYRIEDIDQDNLRTRTELENVSGFVPISDIFETKRGLRLKQTAFFLTNRDKCKQTGATPFVKKIFHVDGYAVSKAHPEAALLVHPDDYNEAVLEELKIRLTAAKKDPDRFQSILNWVKHRPDSWYFHQKPPKAPILFNYYIRNLPRHLLNPIGPYSDNFYGLNWDGDIPAEAVLAIMNSTVVRKEILSRARNQGNGLYKLQLFEYRDVHIPDLRDFDRKTIKKLAGMGAKLIGKSNFPNHIIDNFLFELFPAPELEQEFISKESS